MLLKIIPNTKKRPIGPITPSNIPLYTPLGFCYPFLVLFLIDYCLFLFS